MPPVDGSELRQPPVAGSSTGATGLICLGFDPSTDGAAQVGERVSVELASLDRVEGCRSYTALQSNVPFPSRLICGDLDPTAVDGPAAAELAQVARGLLAGWGLEQAIVRTYRLLSTHSRDEAADASGGDAPFMMFFAMTVVPESLDDLQAWYDQEHIPLLLRVPSWNRIRRFVKTSGKGPEFLAIHDLASLSVYESSEFAAAARTPWLERISRATVERERIVCRLDGRAG